MYRLVIQRRRSTGDGVQPYCARFPSSLPSTAARSLSAVNGSRRMATSGGRRLSIFRRGAPGVGQVDDGQRGMIAPKLGDQSDPVDAFHLGVADDQITPIHHVNQLDRGEDVVGVKDRVTVRPKGLDDKGDGGPVLICYDNA